MQNTLSKLFRGIEAELGTHGFCILALDALEDALSQYRIKNKEEFIHQLIDLIKLLKQTKPQYAILLDSFYKILDLAENSPSDSPVENLVKPIKQIRVDYQMEKLKLIQASQPIDVENKVILIHDHSHSVQSILSAMKEHGKKFTVVVAEQDLEKTEDNIKFLHESGIPYKVVPAHMLSHVDESIDMVFLGAVTLQENMNFVMDPGSKSIISHFFLEKKPIYVFLTTSKFSLWPLKKKVSEIYAKPHRRRHHTLKEIEFERLKFSHDRVSVDIVNHVITEKGIYSPEEVKKMFSAMFKKRATQRQKYLSEDS